MTDFTATGRTRVRRDDRAVYERETVYSVLDEALYCHVGFEVDDQPYVIPTIHVRVGDTLYLHGLPATRMMRTLRDGAPLCVTATLLDGLVIARSAFNHSMNYRSVVVLGSGREVVDEEEKRAALDALVDHVVPGRSAEARPPDGKELRGTAVVAVDVDEASAKVRAASAHDDPDDLDLDVWAGVIPLRLVAGDPEPAPDLREGIPVPPSVSGWRAGWPEE